MKLKRLLSLALAMLMLGAFMAAGTAEEVIELRVLNYLDMTSANAVNGIAIQFDEFEKAHPNIKIVREDEFNEPFHNAVEAYASTGNLPDIIYAWPSGRSTTLHANKLLMDLAPLVARDGLADTYLPLVLDPTAQVSGYMAMFPQGVTATNAFFVNLEVLEAVGLEPAKTYSELVAQVPVLAEAGYETVLMPSQDTWVMQSCLFSLIAGRFCGEGWDQKILAGEAKFTDADFVAALNFVKQMYDDGVLNQSTLAVGYGDGPGQFANNAAAYYIDGDWRVGAFITDQSTGQAVIEPARQSNFLITVFPEIDVEGVKLAGRTNTAVLGTGWGINAALEGDKLEAAWELTKWLVGNEVMSWQVSTGAISTPSRTDIDYSTMDMEPLQVAIANLGGEYDKATVVIDGVFAGPVYEPLNDGLQAIGLGIQTPEQVAEIVQAAYEAWAAAQ